ncbi:MAG: 30S ribosome-binding factor RbfA [Candidatus Omnitrophica bacterium]|nr:30S ribosome-binding factor RbfA [Candidatus Omnitrophota bacterium]
MMGPSRHLRVAESLRREISNIIRSDLKDPRIGHLTVTRVEVTADLQFAKVYISTLDEGKQLEKDLTGLGHAGGYIRTLLKKRLIMKNIPLLDFQLDDSIEFNIKMDHILRASDREQNDADPHKDRE